MCKRLLTSLTLLFFSIMMLSSAPYYDSGSQRFSINAGLLFPLSVTNFKNETTEIGMGKGNTNLKLGGSGSISYQMFTDEHHAIGGEVGYSFNYIIDETLLTNVPILFKATYFPVQGQVDIPLSFGFGINYLNSTDSASLFTLLGSLEAGLDYYITPHWGLGFKCGFYFIPELYPTRYEKNGFGTFIPATFAVTYRQ